MSEASFEVERTSLERVFYLHSPHGMVRRGEEIFVSSATRRERAPIIDDHVFYSEWMIDGSRPIPALPDYSQSLLYDEGGGGLVRAGANAFQRSLAVERGHARWAW